MTIPQPSSPLEVALVALVGIVAFLVLVPLVPLLAEFVVGALKTVVDVVAGDRLPATD